MGMCNSPDNFQEKMNELFIGLNYVKIFIDDLLIISNVSLEDHIQKLNKVLNKYKPAGFKENEAKSYFARNQFKYLGFKIIW